MRVDIIRPDGWVVGDGYTPEREYPIARKLPRACRKNRTDETVAIGVRNAGSGHAHGYGEAENQQEQNQWRPNCFPGIRRRFGVRTIISLHSTQAPKEYRR